jgi:hypothetical protein
MEPGYDIYEFDGFDTHAGRQLKKYTRRDSFSHRLELEKVFQDHHRKSLRMSL